MTVITLYSSWFCPYAQRVWCALNEFNIIYKLVESFDLDPDTHKYIKHPDLLKHNPKGLVPTIVETHKSTNGGEDQTVMKCESLDILKEIHSNYVSKDDVEQCGADADKYNRLICSPFYRVLMKLDSEERQEAWKQMLEGIEAFSNQLNWESNDHSKISFYNGHSDRPSIVDLTVFPWVHRLYILDHFKSLTLEGAVKPSNNLLSEEAKNKILAWQSKMEHHPSVQQTLASREQLIPVYIRYANGSAESKVGDAVRSGKEAHDAKNDN